MNNLSTLLTLSIIAQTGNTKEAQVAKMKAGKVRRQLAFENQDRSIKIDN